MLKSNDVKVFAVAGDWHRNYAYAIKAMNYAKNNGAEIIVHVGDFGYWDESNFVNGINHEAEYLDLIVVFVDGNHEHHALLNSHPVDEDGVRRLAERVWHLPRGFRWQWCGVTFLALGGAHSVDRQWRMQGVDWFPEESITVSDMYKSVQGGIVDVMITHDAPNGYFIPGLTEGVFPEKELLLAEAHRANLGLVVNEVRPKYLFHGHYHVRYNAVRVYPNRKEEACRIIGLAPDKKPFNQNVEIIKVADLT